MPGRTWRFTSPQEDAHSPRVKLGSRPSRHLQHAHTPTHPPDKIITHSDVQRQMMWEWAMHVCACVCVCMHSQASIKTMRDDHNSAGGCWRGSCYRRRTVLQLCVHANDLHRVGCSHFKCIFYHILKKHSPPAPKYAELFPKHAGILNSEFSGGICWYFLKTYNLGGQANCTYELFKLCIIDCSQVGIICNIYIKKNFFLN